MAAYPPSSCSHFLHPRHVLALGGREVVRKRLGPLQVHAGDVDAGEPVPVVPAEPARDPGADVAAAGPEAIVPEHPHERRPDVVDAARPAPRVRGGDRQGRDDEVEAGVGERRHDRQQLGEGAGPAVGEDQWKRPRSPAARVDEVDGEAVDLRQELREGVEPRLGASPVEALLPGGRQRPHVAEIGPERPARAVGLVGPARARQPGSEVLDDGVGDGDAEGLHPPSIVRAIRPRPLAGGCRITG